MEIQYDDTLPCLQAVAPWWSNTDRMMLYCRLLAVFPPLKAEYLSMLDAKSSAEPEYTLTAEMIQSEFQTFRLKCTKGKCSCNAIRSLEFSFGKFNKRLCFLCPFHGTYKNEDVVSEHRFIYYLLNSEKLSLSQYLNGCSRELKDIFISHFPITINGILIDAYPFVLFAEGMANKGAGLYLNDSTACTKSVLEHVYASMAKRIRYNRSLTFMKEKIPDLEGLLPGSADAVWDSILNMTPPFGIVNASIVKRLFNTLSSGERKYNARKPADYVTKEKSLLTSQLQAGMGAVFELSADDGSKPGSDDVAQQPKIIDELPSPTLPDTLRPDEPVIQASGGGAEDIGCQPSGQGEAEKVDGVSRTFPENALSELGIEGILSGESLDERLGITAGGIAVGDSTPELQLNFPNETDGPVIMPENDASDEKVFEGKEKARPEITADRKRGIVPDEVMLEEAVENAKEVTELPLYYELPEDVRIFSYGSDTPEIDQSLLDAFLADSSYFCMEAVRYCGAIGVLIMNADADYVFYNAQLYGPMPLRKLAEESDCIYTSNLLGVSSYLYRWKVCCLKLRDVSILEHCLYGQGFLTEEKSFQCQVMKNYAKVYEQLLKEADEATIDRVETEEGFLPLLYASGNEPPFENMNTVAVVNKRYEVRYVYRQEKVLRTGAMLQVKVLINGNIKSFDEVKRRYEKACIDVDRHYPIAGHSVYILKVTSEGILIYAAGNRLDIQRLQFYLSSSCKRVFAECCGNEPVTLYETREDYSPTAELQRKASHERETDGKTERGRKKKRG